MVFICLEKNNACVLACLFFETEYQARGAKLSFFPLQNDRHPLLAEGGQETIAQQPSILSKAVPSQSPTEETHVPSADLKLIKINHPKKRFDQKPPTSVCLILTSVCLIFKLESPTNQKFDQHLWFSPRGLPRGTSLYRARSPELARSAESPGGAMDGGAKLCRVRGALDSHVRIRSNWLFACACVCVCVCCVYVCTCLGMSYI